jgi:hypothetical protein
MAYWIDSNLMKDPEAALLLTVHLPEGQDRPKPEEYPALHLRRVQGLLAAELDRLLPANRDDLLRDLGLDDLADEAALAEYDPDWVANLLPNHLRGEGLLNQEIQAYLRDQKNLQRTREALNLEAEGQPPDQDQLLALDREPGAVALLLDRLLGL